MSAAFVVTFVAYTGTSGILILGVYASEEDARAAIIRASAHPIFAAKGDLFFIDEYQIGKDDWPSWLAAAQA